MRVRVQRVMGLFAASFCCVSAIGMAQSGDHALIGFERFQDLQPIGTIQPRSSREIDDSRWGLQFNVAPRADNQRMLDRIAESGVKWTRVWTQYEIKSPQDGYYDWKRLDEMIYGLTERKINIFVCINCRGEDGRTQLPDDFLEGTNMPGERMFGEKQMEDYLAGVALLVKRYGHVVKHWEIFNEPEITPLYAKTVREASKTIKKIDPEAKVLAGSMSRTQFKMFDILFADKTDQFIDVITYHPYNEAPEADAHKWYVPTIEGYSQASVLIRDVQKTIRETNARIELWQGECGYPSSGHTDSWKGRGPWGENIQAKWLLRRFFIDHSLDFKVSIYFLLREWVNHGKCNAKGLLTDETGRPKQAYRTLQNVTSVFDGRLKTSSEFDCSFSVEDEGGFTGIAGENSKDYQKRNAPYQHAKSPYPIEVVGFSGSAGAAVAYWIPWRMQEYVKPGMVDIRVKDVHIVKPVLIDMLSGKVYRAPINQEGDDLVIRHVPIADYPFVIVSEEVLKLE